MNPSGAQDGAPRRAGARASVHARMISALQDQLPSPVTITDAWVAGTEEVILSLEIGETRHRRDLHLLLLAPEPLFWLEPVPRRHTSPPAGFGLWLRRHLYGARVTAAHAGRSGRILRLDLDAQPAEEVAPRALILDPLPNACRLLVVDARETVLQRYPPTIHGSPSGRGMPGETYEEPEGQPSEFWEREALHAKTHPTESGAPAGEASAASAERLWLCTGALPPPGPGEARRAVIYLSPCPCPTAARAAAAGPPAGPLPPLEAAQRAGALWRQLARHRLHARQLRQLLQRERRHLARLEKRLRRELTEASGGARLRRQAEALLAHGRRIPKGAQRITLDDPAAPGEQIEITLDPTLSFSQNAARLFQRAGRLERALPIRKHKHEQVQHLLQKINAWLAGGKRDDLSLVRQAESAAAGRPAAPPAPSVGEGESGTYEEARALSAKLEPALRRRWQALVREWAALRAALRAPIDYVGYEARKSGTATRESTPGPAGGIYPRRYELPGNWIVLVGRSNKENDILTHRLARPNDLWLHARGVAGSHVVLRREGHHDRPPKSIIEAAARIAAYYSKGRTSGMVPVIYTEKRYVRKPRRATPGLAVCMREKVLLVEPRLPVEERREG